MMIDPAERNERVMTLAAEALKTPLRERDSFLQRACQNDPELYREVSEVVTWEERMSTFLRRPLIEFIDLDTLERVFEPGQIVSGRFEIVRCVGDGGMGVVYEAFDNKRRQQIAIKVAKPGFGRLLSPELEGALRVRHPNICVVNEIHSTETEFGELDFLTMELLDGETLSRRLAQSRLDQAEALEIARQLCAGVAEAHRSGVLHRDLKPGNVILCRKKDGATRAVITDFGLSTQSAVASEVGGGTPSYMAPELSRDGKPSQASDVFSLGVILYEMITGQKPFPSTAESNGTVHPPVVPSKLVRNLPRRWDSAILPCLRTKPEERCSAEEILDALERKPLYLRPALVVPLAACLVLAAMVTPRIVDFFKPPSIRLAMLPVQGSGGLAERGQQILNDVAARVQQMQIGKATASVIPLSKALSKGVASPQEAERVLGATHVLQLTLRPDADGLAVKGAVIDLATMAHVQDYSAHFAEADLADLSAGLAGLVSWALHLHRSSQPETVAPAAITAYENGRRDLNREPREPHAIMDAMREFQEAALLDPHSPLPLAGLAEAHTREYQDRRDEKASAEAQLWLARAEALNADSPSVRMASGLLHTLRGDYPRALEDYLRVEEIEPGNVDALLGSGFALELQGMLDKAMTEYRLAISIDPNNYKPYEYLGALHFNRGQYDLAEEQYKKDVERASDRVDAYGSLAAVYIAQFKYAEAEKIYKESLRIKETALTLNNIGVMLAFQGLQKEAVEYYQRAVTMAPNWPIYWLNLGDSQRRLNDQVSANDSYRRGLAVALNQVTASAATASARASLAYLQARLGMRDQARSEIVEALNSPARDDQVVLCAVETYEALGERERALATAVMATSQTRAVMRHHPDLADLSRDSRF